MHQLRDQRNALGVHGVDHSSPALDMSIDGQPGLIEITLTVCDVCIGALGDHDTEPAARELGIIGDHFVGWRTVGCRRHAGHRGYSEPVLEVDGTDSLRR